MANRLRFSYVVAAISLALTAAFSGSAAQAQLAIGGEIACNNFTTDNQLEPAVALTPSGGFIVAFQSDGADGDGLSVEARRFGGNGLPLGNEFSLANLTTSHQSRPTIGTLAGGSFVAAWSSLVAPGDTGPYGVSARQFADDGIPIADELLVNAVFPGWQHRADIAVHSTGSFVVVWQDDAQEVSSGIYARVFDAGGSPVTGEIHVNQTTANFQGNPAIAMSSTGDFIVAWQSETGDGSLTGVFARQFQADGDPIDNEFPVNTFTVGNQHMPDVAMRPTGEFIVVWQSAAQDGSGEGIYAQRFDALGDPIGIELPVNLRTVDNQIEPSVGVADDGTFVVIWRDMRVAGSGEICGRAFAPSGSPHGGDFLVNTPSAFDQGSPAIALAGNGDFVVAWQSEVATGAGYEIVAQRFDGNYLFRDGFESGDTLAWSLAFP